MKCPVCDQENPSMLCPRCGFDASRDYEKYPTLGGDPLCFRPAQTVAGAVRRPRVDGEPP